MLYGFLHYIQLIVVTEGCSDLLVESSFSSSTLCLILPIVERSKRLIPERVVDLRDGLADNWHWHPQCQRNFLGWVLRMEQDFLNASKWCLMTFSWDRGFPKMEKF